MHTALVLALSLFPLLSPITAQDLTTFTNYAQIQSDIGAYISSLVAQPAFTSVQSVLATGIPGSILDDPSANAAGFLATATALPSYYTALPSDVLSYLRSVGLAEISIVTKDLGAGGASTEASGASTAAAGTSTMAASTVPSTMVTSTVAVGAVGPLGTTSSASVTSAATPTAASTGLSAPSTTTSTAAAPSALAVQAAGVLVAVGAVGLALL